MAFKIIKNVDGDFCLTFFIKVTEYGANPNSDNTILQI